MSRIKEMVDWLKSSHGDGYCTLQPNTLVYKFPPYVHVFYNLFIKNNEQKTINAYGGRFDLSVKQVKVKPKVIIWRILVVLEYPMLHAKFQDRRLIRSGKDFTCFLPYYGQGIHLGHVTMTVWRNFRSPRDDGCLPKL